MAQIFFLHNGAGHPELWVTDGTAGGTHFVHDFVLDNGASLSSPGDMTNVNGTLYLSAEDGVVGKELWKSDGTTGGTVLVKDIAPGSDSNGAPKDSTPDLLTNFNGTLYFTASGEVWKSNGTETGTVQVKDIHPGPASASPSSLTKVGNTLFFSATNSLGTGSYLWMSDGSEAGTVMALGAANGNSFNPRNLVDFNGMLFFSGNDGSAQGAHGQELWKFNGASVEMVADIWPGTGNGSGSSSPEAMFVGTRGATPILYFVANDGSHGKELWESDGSASGTMMVKDIRPGSGALASVSAFGDVVEPFAAINGILYFVANDGMHGFELWRSDGVPDPNGTGSGTRMVNDISSSAGIHNLTAVGDKLYFTASDGSGHGVELWKVDNTSSDPVMVKDIRLGGGSSDPSHLTNIGGSLFFSADDGSGVALWRSDGTEATTVKIATGFVGSEIVATDTSGLAHATLRPGDFDGNQHSDILWQRDDATVAVWDNGQIGGAHWIANPGVVPATWHIADKGDFDGNGHSDILWRNDDGSTSIWDNGAIGGAHIISAPGVVPNSWRISGTGDFDGNRHDDILWRNDDGSVSIWDNGAIGSAHIISGPGVVANSWHISGTGDFDGNGQSDILWRNDDGAASIWDNGAIGSAHIIAAAGVVPSGWNIAGTGDFDGNGHDDILWRNDNGAVSIWDNGQIGSAHIVSAAGVVATSWHISGTGDFDGNSHSDILWHNDNGAASIWDNGDINQAHIIADAGAIPAGWHIV